MFIVNTSFLVETAIEAKWSRWTKENFVPMLRSVQGAGEIVFCKVLSNADEQGETYSLQIRFVKSALANAFITQEFGKLIPQMDKQFSGRFLLFQTLMGEV